eukprot:7873483-Alexandrium_andersonii.AAC.1
MPAPRCARMEPPTELVFAVLALLRASRSGYNAACFCIWQWDGREGPCLKHPAVPAGPAVQANVGATTWFQELQAMTAHAAH